MNTGHVDCIEVNVIMKIVTDLNMDLVSKLIQVQGHQGDIYTVDVLLNFMDVLHYSNHSVHAGITYAGTLMVQYYDVIVIIGLKKINAILASVRQNH